VRRPPHAKKPYVSRASKLRFIEPQLPSLVDQPAQHAVQFVSGVKSRCRHPAPPAICSGILEMTTMHSANITARKMSRSRIISRISDGLPVSGLFLCRCDQVGAVLISHDQMVILAGIVSSAPGLTSGIVMVIPPITQGTRRSPGPSLRGFFTALHGTKVADAGYD
jgi:hypothetical protein